MVKSVKKKMIKKQTKYLILLILEFLSIVEKYIFRKKKKFTSFNHSLLSEGCYKSEKKIEKLPLMRIDDERKHSDYSSLYIINKNDIMNLINEIFIKEKIFDEIYAITGMNYCVDFFAYYKTLSIPKELESKQFYANLWHNDSMFTKNVLKLFLVPKEINMNCGPLNWINIKDTNKQLNQINQSNLFIEDNYKINYLTGKVGDIFIMNPNLCLHKAGVPQNGNSRELIMFQLNPSKYKSIRSNIYERQLSLEPNMPIIKNLFQRKVILN